MTRCTAYVYRLVLSKIIDIVRYSSEAFSTLYKYYYSTTEVFYILVLATRVEAY